MTMYDAAGRKQHVPDILDCLAQLSNDEVPTPPKLARAMLDLLPAEVWSNPDYRWLDPCCKSGAILREIAARLLAGLEAWEPDFGNRREHIFRNMLFRSEEHTSELQPLMRISYAVFCLKKKTNNTHNR